MSLALLILLVAYTFPCAASDSRALQLLQHGTDVSNIRTAETAPFRLTVRVHIGGDQPIDGQYVLIRAAPDQWREEISTGNSQAIRIGGKHIVSTKNDTAAVQTIRSKIRSLDVGAILQVKENEKLSGVKKRRHDHIEVGCFTKTAKLTGQTELCFDPAIGILLTTHSRDWTDEFSKYAEFEGKQFPRLVSTSRNGKVVSSIEVEQLTTVIPDGSLFNTDGQFQTSPGCRACSPPNSDRIA